MRRFGSFACVLALSLWTSPRASSEELKLPWPSPAATITQTIGVTDITLSYHRPSSKGRDLEKELAMLAAAKQPWRIGANEATRLVVTDTIRLGDEEIPAGEYGLFAYPAADEWTIIVSRQARTWGAYFYDSKQDVTRLYVKPTHSDESVDWMTFSIDPITANSAALRFAWANVRLEIPIVVDVDGIVSKRIDDAIANLDAKDWDTRVGIVKYWCNRNENLERALAMSEEAIKIERHFWTCEWKARVLEKLGKRKEAVPLLEEAIRLAEGKAPKEYGAALAQLVKEWKS